MINEEAAKAGHEVVEIYIGKSHIDKTEQFNEYDANTWGEDGISSRRSSHKDYYGTQHFKVVAVVTEGFKYEDNGILENAEEYALILEKQLIENFMRMKTASERLTLLNVSTRSGSMTKEEKAGYVVYMAARTGGK